MLRLVVLVASALLVAGVEAQTATTGRRLLAVLRRSKPKVRCSSYVFLWTQIAEHAFCCVWGLGVVLPSTYERGLSGDE